MAGGGTPTPTKGGKKSVDFTVNLVPTIDLMSVLISFLLITAVWTQLARINTDNVMQKSDTKPKQDQPPEERKDLKILLDDKGILVRFTGEEPQRVEGGEQLMTRFRSTIEAYKKRAAENQRVIVSAHDRVNYEALIQVMDICLDLGLNALSVGDPTSFES